MGLNKLIPFECSFCVKVEGHAHIKALNVVKEGDVIRHLRPLARVCQRSAPAFAGMQGVLRYNNSSADKDLSAVDWRRRWDSNPRALSDNRISSAARYDHFDTSPRAFAAGGISAALLLYREMRRMSSPSVPKLGRDTQKSQEIFPALGHSVPRRNGRANAG